MTLGRRPTAAVVIIGNEVLSGKVADANGPYLIRRLREVGVSLCHLEVVLDDPAAIGDAVRRASVRADVVFTTGGVGPTHDDITVESIAGAFGVAVTRAPALEALVARYFGEHATEAAMRLAMVPEGSELVGDDTPPWPTVRFRNVYILPGIPRLMHAKFEALVPELGGEDLFAAALMVVANEADLCDVLQVTVDAHPAVEIGSYPQKIDGTWKVRLTLEGGSAAEVGEALRRLEADLAPVVERVEPPRSTRLAVVKPAAG